MGWVELDDVIEAFAELFDFVGSEIPVACLSGQPELGVPHLLKRHDFAETRRIDLVCPFLGLRRRSGLAATNRGAGEDDHKSQRYTHHRLPFRSCSYQA